MKIDVYCKKEVKDIVCHKLTSPNSFLRFFLSFLLLCPLDQIDERSFGGMSTVLLRNLLPKVTPIFHSLHNFSTPFPFMDLETYI